MRRCPTQGADRRTESTKARTFRSGPSLILEAAPGIEPGMEVLQTSALPLGYAALRGVRL